MSYLFENQNPAVQQNGFNTNKAVALGSTLSVTGTATLTGAITATGGVTSPTTLTSATGVATTAGGSTTAGLLMGTAGFGIYFGSGAPTIVAVQGSLYIRSDGSTTATRLYVNGNGASTWVAVTTAS